MSSYSQLSLFCFYLLFPFLHFLVPWGFSFIPPGLLQINECCQRMYRCQSSMLWGLRGKGNPPIRMPFAWTRCCLSRLMLYSLVYSFVAAPLSSASALDVFMSCLQGVCSGFAGHGCHICFCKSSTGTPIVCFVMGGSKYSAADFCGAAKDFLPCLIPFCSYSFLVPVTAEHSVCLINIFKSRDMYNKLFWCCLWQPLKW